jgi:integrase
MPAGKFVTVMKIVPTGSLQARKDGSGATKFYWRFSIDTKSERVSIGLYDSAAAPKSLTPTKKGFSVLAAARAAETLALKHYEHRRTGGHPALMAADRAAQAAQDEARKNAAQHTLSNLLDLYCDYLQGLNRNSHKDARSIFNLHIKQAWPNLATKPAKEVTAEQFADMMRKLIETGKKRTANKLRAYARAAYQAAKAARSKPSIPVAFKDFGITTNPVADTLPDETGNRSAKRPLSANELRTYWRNIRTLSGIQGALLRLHLLTGGQRIAQFVRLLTENVSNDCIVLFDSKGRPGQPPRPHTVPLISAARSALAEVASAGKWALSTDGGKTHIAATSLSKWAVEAAGDEIPEFLTKRIRSGIETLLASARVSSDTRGRLQSHGISGVQSRHYDGHDYFDEKLESLETVFLLLESASALAYAKGR